MGELCFHISFISRIKIDKTTGIYEFSFNSGISSRTLFKVNTMPIQTSSVDQLESDSSQHKLERSKTEMHKHKFLAEEAAKIFDDKIPVHRKV